MADIIGTAGNDVLANPGGGTLTLVLSGSFADGGVGPVINVLVNGVVVQANVAITASHAAGATQTVSVPVTGAVSSVAVDYANDTQTDGSYARGEDRNLYISSITLNGTALDPATGSYVRTQNGAFFDVIQGQADMVWGGTLTISGASVQAAGSGGSSNDIIDGLAGLDTLVYSGARAEYGIGRASATSFTVTHASEVDTLVNVERLQFGNVKHALDMDGNAGAVAKMIGALFGQGGLGIVQYVGVGLSLMDQGRTALQLADLAVNTSQFQQVAGSFSNADFVHAVAANIGYTGDVSGFVQQLDAGGTTKAALTLLAMDTSFNAAHLVGVMQNGIDYV
jgi:hypothetical protein